MARASGAGEVRTAEDTQLRTTAEMSSYRSAVGSSSKEAHFGLKDDYLDEMEN
ncbi:unnamed protein product [Dovyalis caffra]|uniref:Uncharacterized protein n=1 Tax=Dovyalis caffra TaxID=77055 RepID=A0AAV1RDB4_9ROSI|nr:unnamed protein product [Dovyalis caffra]